MICSTQTLLLASFGFQSCLSPGLYTCYAKALVTLPCQLQLVSFWHWSICEDRGTELCYTFQADSHNNQESILTDFLQTCILSGVTWTAETRLDTSSEHDSPSHLCQHSFHLKKDEICVVLSRCGTLQIKAFNMLNKQLLRLQQQSKLHSVSYNEQSFPESYSQKWLFNTTVWCQHKQNRTQ